MLLRLFAKITVFECGNRCIFADFFVKKSLRSGNQMPLLGTPELVSSKLHKFWEIRCGCWPTDSSTDSGIWDMWQILKSSHIQVYMWSSKNLKVMQFLTSIEESLWPWASAHDLWSHMYDHHDLECACVHVHFRRKKTRKPPLKWTFVMSVLWLNGYMACDFMTQRLHGMVQAVFCQERVGSRLLSEWQWWISLALRLARILRWSSLSATRALPRTAFRCRTPAWCWPRCCQGCTEPSLQWERESSRSRSRWQIYGPSPCSRWQIYGPSPCCNEGRAHVHVSQGRQHSQWKKRCPNISRISCTVVSSQTRNRSCSGGW